MEKLKLIFNEWNARCGGIEPRQENNKSGEVGRFYMFCNVDIYWEMMPWKKARICCEALCEAILFNANGFV